MFTISDTIEQAIKDCKIFGNGNLKINDNISVTSDWESYDNDSSYDIITIYIYENNIIKLRYQVEETLTSVDY